MTIAETILLKPGAGEVRIGGAKLFGLDAPKAANIFRSLDTLTALHYGC
jgi:hypothetical protein